MLNYETEWMSWSRSLRPPTRRCGDSRFSNATGILSTRPISAAACRRSTRARRRSWPPIGGGFARGGGQPRGVSLTTRFQNAIEMAARASAPVRIDLFARRDRPRPCCTRGAPLLRAAAAAVFLAPRRAQRHHCSHLRSVLSEARVRSTDQSAWGTVQDMGEATAASLIRNQRGAV